MPPKTKIFIVILSFFVSAHGENFNLGGFFEEGENELMRAAFNLAIAKVNEKGEDLQLQALYKTLPDQDPFGSIKTTCDAMRDSIVGIFGPKSLANINSVQSVCDEKEIPHMLTRWMYYPLRTGTAINFYPSASLLTKAYWEIIQKWEWKTFTVLYEDDESLLRMSELVVLAKEEGIVVTVEQLDRDGTGNYRDALKRVWKTKQKYLVVDCHLDNLVEVLVQCQQLGLMTSDYSYFLTNLDAHTKELSPFKWSQTNITGIRLINPDSTYVQEVSKDLISNTDPTDEPVQIASKLETEAAFMFDAVHMFYETLKKLSIATPPPTLDCDQANSWEFGYSFVNILKASSYKGLTGTIEFNNEGQRNTFGLEVYEIREGGIINVGNYNSTLESLIVVPQHHVVEEVVDEDSMRNRTFVVVISLTEPYGMLKETSENLVGNDRYEGFSIDLIHELSLIEGFNYTFIVQHDGKNGNKEANGQWSGMIGKVMYGAADMAITDLTITSARASAVDFTIPFMNLGISILFQKPTKSPPNFFSFAEPFAIDTWIALAIAFAVVSLSFFLLGRICPDEWNNPYPCVEEPEYLINQFTMSNSVWFATGAMLQQGSEIAPIAIPTRLVSGVWWFFVLIMVSSYTANLASFLVSESNIELITDVKSLIENADKYGIRYGSKMNGATMEFFESSTNELYLQIGRHMREHPEDMPLENKEGVAWAETMRYAFFMESTSIDYNTQRHCNLKRVGDPLDEKGYGIALKKDSRYRNKLSTAILKLQSSGVIEKIRKKWWEERKGGGQCTGPTDDAEATPLDLQNVEGIFYVTIFGTILGVVLVLFEYTFYIMRLSKKTKIPFGTTLKKELKFFFKFGSNVKPVLEGSDADEKSHEESQTKTVSQRSKTKSEQSRITSNGNAVRPYGFVLSHSLDRLTDSPS
ncbi:glutamate receptor ionotropic, kainate 2-like [Euwallacea similis]|uniref:glutamate receptor ionotropic, kainate 2-like n=1 Tax=Euwallacea similis TaxID=1736056 RepID=UPI00344FAB52